MKKIARPRTALAAGIAKVLKRLHYPLDVMLLCVRWYVAYSLSLRDLEEMMAERTLLKVKGSWKYLYRAVDKAGNTIDFLFRAKRDKAAARRFFEKAIGQNGSPETVTIDKSGSNLAALHAVNAERETPIKVRQVKYLNNVVEQDHRAIKRRTRPMLGFKDFDCARVILSGIKVMHMIKKGQMKDFGKVPLSAAAVLLARFISNT